MKNIKSIALLLALAAWPVLSAPCRAQLSALPVLKRYLANDWIYFASAHDDALVFKNPSKDGSNVWVAAARSPVNRRILAKSNAWTDSRGRLHTVGVLKLQMEYNDYRRSLGAQTNVVDETGVLDCQTLAIPNSKMYVRLGRIQDRLREEDATVKLLESTDVNGASVRKKFSAYLWEKVWAANERLDELNRTVFAVPQTSPGAATPAGQTLDAGAYSGLSGLEIPAVTPYDLRLAGASSDEIRFVSVDERFNPENFESLVVDPQRMTPDIVADIRQKETAAEKAVSFAENLCKDLLTPPCQ